MNKKEEKKARTNVIPFLIVSLILLIAYTAICYFGIELFKPTTTK